METVAALRAALERAKSGEITGVATVEFYADGYRFVLTGSARNNLALTAAVLSVVQQDVVRETSAPASAVSEMPVALPRRSIPDRA